MRHPRLNIFKLREGSIMNPATELSTARPTPRAAPVRGHAADPKALYSLAVSLLSEPGEASGVALAKQILSGYSALGAADRLEFLQILADRFGPDPARLKTAIDRYRDDPSTSSASASFAASEPPR